MYTLEKTIKIIATNGGCRISRRGFQGEPRLCCRQHGGNMAVVLICLNIAPSSRYCRNLAKRRISPLQITQKNYDIMSVLFPVEEKVPNDCENFNVDCNFCHWCCQLHIASNDPVKGPFTHAIFNAIYVALQCNFYRKCKLAEI